VLKPVTRRFRDLSSDTEFQIAFYCDRCGKEWRSDIYRFDDYFPVELTDGQRRARDIMWRTDHDNAFERANLSARLHFNKCESCGNNVCDDCCELEDDTEECMDCAKLSRR
jgi:hypothetical protein